MELDTALKHAIDGHALLFVGSGFSIGAKPLQGDSFLTGRALARRLYEECGMVPPDEDLYYASQRYRRQFHDRDLVKILQNLFTAKTVNPLHERFAEIKWRGIFTTNYDDILEKAFSNRGAKLVPITLDRDTNTFTSRSNCCVHINGFIDNLTEAALAKSFKLTNTSYLTEEFSKSNWSLIFRKSLETSRSIIFFGYSMYDLDIGRILFSDPHLKAKTIFIESKDAPPEYLNNSIQNEFGEIFPVGMDGFWTAFDIAAANHVRQDEPDAFFSFTELKISDAHVPMRDDDAFAFLLKGEVNLDIIMDGALDNGQETYFMRREHHKTVLDEIEAGERCIVVSSDMANGKTTFAYGIACALIAKGYRAFVLNESIDRVYEEINSLTSLKTPVVVILENYTRRVEELKYLLLKRQPNLVLLLATKTVFQEVFREKLEDILVDDSAFELALDKLSNQDIRNFSDLLSTYKFWADKDAWSVERKRRYLVENCGSELSACLLGIVKSPEIQARFAKLFEAFGRNDDLSRVVITASALKLLGYEGSKTMVAELLDDHYIFSLDFRNNPLALELLDLSAGRLVPRSSVLAQYGLTTFANTRFLIDQLIAVARKAHNLGYGGRSDLFFGIYVSIVNYTVVQSMLPEKGKRDALIRFYEGLKSLSSAVRHPHFWLQYAIARLAYDQPDDLVKAKLYLDAAYSHAKAIGPKYHTRHMDNVLARYYLKVGVVETDIDKAFAFFIDANAILLKQARSEKTEAPYKVARGYSAFYTAKKAFLSDERRKFIGNAANEIMVNIPHLPAHVREEMSIRGCQAELVSVVADIERRA